MLHYVERWCRASLYIILYRAKFVNIWSLAWYYRASLNTQYNIEHCSILSHHYIKRGLTPLETISSLARYYWASLDIILSLARHYIYVKRGLILSSLDITFYRATFDTQRLHVGGWRSIARSILCRASPAWFYIVLWSILCQTRLDVMSKPHSKLCLTSLDIISSVHRSSIARYYTEWAPSRDIVDRYARGGGGSVEVRPKRQQRGKSPCRMRIQY